MPRTTPIERLRKICLALPEAYEQRAADHFTQDLVVRRWPERYYVPPYAGAAGWFGIYLDRGPDWQEVADRLRESYRMLANNRQLEKLDALPAARSPRAARDRSR